MFDEVSKYKNNGHFFFRPHDQLADVCNAPADKYGVFQVFALAGGRIELIYIGSSGRIPKEEPSTILGLKDIIINGKQENIARNILWADKVRKENIEALDVYWWITYNQKTKDVPQDVETSILNHYFSIYGRFPKWNAAHIAVTN